MILPIVCSNHPTWLSLAGGLGVPLQQPLQHVAEQRLESGPRWVMQESIRGLACAEKSINRHNYQQYIETCITIRYLCITNLLKMVIFIDFLFLYQSTTG